MNEWVDIPTSLVKWGILMLWKNPLHDTVFNDRNINFFVLPGILTNILLIDELKISILWDTQITSLVGETIKVEVM